MSRAITAVDGVSEILVHTGQHFDPGMSQIFFEELGLAAPRVNLGIHGGGHGEMTGRMLAALERIIIEERPDLVLVPGDTTSTLAGALAAAKLHVPIAHLEAGLRSYNRRMPEEINRVLTDHVSALLLCPTSTAVDNLRREGIVGGVHHIGDVMYDATLLAAAAATATTAATTQPATATPASPPDPVAAAAAGALAALLDIAGDQNAEDEARIAACVEIRGFCGDAVVHALINSVPPPSAS